MIFTYANGTPLGPHLNERGENVPAAQYEIEGTLANRTGANLERAIEAECGFGAGTVTVSGTNVIVEGQTIATLADGESDRASNDWFAVHVGYLLKQARGDRRTLLKTIAKRVVRILKFERGLTKAQVQALFGNLYDAVTTPEE